MKKKRGRKKPPILSKKSDMGFNPLFPVEGMPKIIEIFLGAFLLCSYAEYEFGVISSRKRKTKKSKTMNQEAIKKQDPKLVQIIESMSMAVAFRRDITGLITEKVRRINRFQTPVDIHEPVVPENPYLIKIADHDEKGELSMVDNLAFMANQMHEDNFVLQQILDNLNTII